MQKDVRSEYILLEGVPGRALASSLNTDKIKHVIVNTTDKLLCTSNLFSPIKTKERSAWSLFFKQVQYKLYVTIISCHFSAPKIVHLQPHMPQAASRCISCVIVKFTSILI